MNVLAWKLRVFVLAVFVLSLAHIAPNTAHALDTTNGERMLRMGFVSFGGVQSSAAGNKLNASGHTFAGASLSSNGELLVSGLHGPLFDAGVACDYNFHSADTNQSNSITLSELLRGIQFFNIGAFSCDITLQSEDGYLPNAGDQTCCQYALDYNAFDWNVNLVELLRLIQFFNVGAYYYCPLDINSDDGYCPGTP